MMVEDVIVLGNGFLGREFGRRGCEVRGRDRFNWPSESAFSELSCKAIINCVAKTETSWCEDDRNFSEAMSVNADLPRHLSMFCAAAGIKFVHISTGCLYDGLDDRSTEDGDIAAHCNYTVTKWVGEKGCDLGKDIVLRPRLLFGSEPCPNNLLCKLARYHSYVDHYYDSLSSVETVVDAALALLDAEVSGIFNVAETGTATMLDVAHWCRGFDKAAEPLETTIANVRAARGLHLVNSTMSTAKLRRHYTPPFLRPRVMECWETIRKKI